MLRLHPCYPVPVTESARACEPHSETVNIDQAARLASVSRRTIYHWLHRGRLAFIRTAGGSIRIYPDTLWRPGAMDRPQPTRDIHV